MIFVARTNDAEDLQWLDHLVSTTSGYSRHNITEPGGDPSKVNYGEVWEIVEKGVMYIKIDDDVVRNSILLQPAHSACSQTTN